MTLAGSEPSLPGLLLNSHMDVVPVSAEHWAHDPFAANVTEDGDIIARGAQDMKCVGMAYLEALRRMRIAGFLPRRSIHLFYTPDEEIGSEAGAAAIVASGWLEELNIGFGLDEGIPSPSGSLFIFDCERSIWCIKETAG
jgi:aminoacylase